VSDAPQCLGPGGELAAEHEPATMTAVDCEPGGWQCPVCKTIIREGRR